MLLDFLRRLLGFTRREPRENPTLVKADEAVRSARAVVDAFRETERSIQGRPRVP